MYQTNHAKSTIMHCNSYEIHSLLPNLGQLRKALERIKKNSTQKIFNVTSIIKKYI